VNKPTGWAIRMELISNVVYVHAYVLVLNLIFNSQFGTATVAMYLTLAIDCKQICPRGGVN